MTTNPTWWEDEIVEYDEEDDVQHECDYCHGDGGDPYNDGVIPCPKCHGEGHFWWLRTR